ncbi:MAG: hypothetical protein LBS28_04660 [Streptococcaceae bacterium]|jgi:hypothetical protein|nr:hypothetical protein [Streptococcaceae bacterium]
MFKIFRYELKRLAFSKFFIITLIVAAFFSIYVLNTKIIKGVGYTAPFSQWSFSCFLCEVQPFLLLVLMFFITMLFTKNETLVKEITLSTPISYAKYFVLKISSIFAAYFLITSVFILISMGFYVFTFRFTNFSHFILPLLLILLPSFIFVFGIGLFLGSKKITWLYTFMPIVLILSFLKIEMSPFLDIFAKGFINHEPFILPLGLSGEVDFKLSLIFIISRIILIFFGGFSFISVLKRNI